MCGAKKEKFVVVIDAGHGGNDSGAAENRAIEKDINLGIALKLEAILKKKKDIKVVMTRNKDKSVSLHDRAAKANKEKADLFISIHTNSLKEDNPKRKTVEGAMVFVLGHSGDADNLAVAQRENRVIVKEEDHEEKYEGFDPDKDESYIIFEMMQKNTLSRSIGFARIAQQELVKTAGRKDRGVHQAGFLVLRETAMPSVLIEVDFICNPQSARYIASSAGQKKIAQSIANAVVTYRKNIEKKGDKAYADATLDGEMQDSGECFVLVSDVPASDRTVSHETKDNNKKRQSSVPRKRRSLSSKKASSQRNLETDYIAVRTEGKADKVISTPSQETNEQKKKEKTSEKVEKKKQSKAKNKKQTEKKNDDDDDNVRIYGNKKVRINTPSSSNPRSLKSDKDVRSGAPVKIDDADKEKTNDEKTDVGNKNKQNKDESESMSVNDEVKAAMDAASGKQNSKTEKDSKKKKDKTNQTKQKNKEGKDSSIEKNKENYEKTIQKSANKNKTNAAPVSLKSKKHKTNNEK